MSKKIVKLGVIGLGRGLQCTVNSIGMDNVVMRAICDKNPDKLKEAKRIFEEEHKVENLLCFDNFEDLIKSDIDALMIATDAVCHVPYAIAAMEAGKHVLSEIPTVNSLEEAKALRKVVKAHPELKYVAAENACFNPLVKVWKTMYEEGKLGDAVYCEAEYFHGMDYRDIKAEKYPKGHWRTYNPAIKYLTHDLGPLLYIMNDKCVSVTCMVPDICYNPYKSVEAQNGVALFKTAKGAVIRILIDFGTFVDYNHGLTILGTRGSLETDRKQDIHSEIVNTYASFSDLPGTREKKVELPIRTMKPGGKDQSHGGLDRIELEEFINCIINDTEPPIDVDLGIRMTLPGIYAAESSHNGSSAVDIIDPEDF